MPKPEPLPFDARAIGEEALRRLAEIDFLCSPERREANGPHRETRAADAQRIEYLTTSVDRLTRIAQVAADVSRDEQVRADTRDIASQSIATSRREDVDEA